MLKEEESPLYVNCKNGHALLRDRYAEIVKTLDISKNFLRREESPHISETKLVKRNCYEEDDDYSLCGQQSGGGASKYYYYY